MQEIIETLIENYGFTREMLLFLLYIPVIATIVNFARYFVGAKMYGIYAPMILAFAYAFTGIRFGLLITLAVVLATLLSYTALSKVRMHYLARISINYSVIAFFIIGFIYLNELSPIKITSEHYALTNVTPLGIVLIATLSDFFIKQYVKKSFLVTIRSLAETVIVAIIGWWLLSMRNNGFGDFLLYNIWVFPILILLNIGLGQYTGLRLKDFSRFKEVVRS